MAKKFTDKLKEDKQLRNRWITLFIILGLFLVVNVLWIAFNQAFKVVRLRGSIEWNTPTGHEIVFIGATTEFNDVLDPDELWYYNVYGGVWTVNSTDPDSQMRVYSQRILLDAEIEQIIVLVVFNETATGDLKIAQKTVDLFASTDIELVDVNLALGTLEVIVTDLPFWVEPIFNVLA